MILQHSAITSPVFELVETIELDITLGDDFYPTRIELFRARGDAKRFRCRVLQSEFYRIQSTFPQSEDGTPSHQSSDELILVEYSSALRCDWDPDNFTAGSIVDARTMIDSALLAFLDHTTAKPGS